ncbi:DUF72 domain-containing protein [Pseudomonas arsenicoxydans]|uniref:DUF72 domain-containing protein n=1 Tax=Pseudomonas arsenicoxydans TaxID=702115 RepID=A0A502HSL5_9PSED|nr:DUF72 domain-containing protein [Pseudomonas arsenicoxydans]TPG76178.1 DUF72 domain-containing protein [Pseudomonas arsenicoxydans]
MSLPIFIGCAGWSLAREFVSTFPVEGTHLQRYASQLNSVEINSSFYRPHRRETYARWADSVPDGFRFCVKVPKLITHERRLQDCGRELDEFISQCSGLNDRLGCLLVQLPPSLAFEYSVVEAFFSDLRRLYTGHVVVEPRHASWLDAEPLLIHHRIARAAVDPSRISHDAQPAGWPGLKYWRLHGSPRTYFSPYELPTLQRLAIELENASAAGETTWCIFDNTASGAALGNALSLNTLLR